jgi:hypothetical protein
MMLQVKNPKQGPKRDIQVSKIKISVKTMNSEIEFISYANFFILSIEILSLFRLDTPTMNEQFIMIIILIINFRLLITSVHLRHSKLLSIQQQISENLNFVLFGMSKEKVQLPVIYNYIFSCRYTFSDSNGTCVHVN